MIKNFVFACVIAIAMPALALIPDVPEASKSLGLNNNAEKSEILGGEAIAVGGEDFSVYEKVRNSDTNYAAKVMDNQHPHGGRLLEDTDTAWSFLTVVNVGGAQKDRSIIWSIGKKSTYGIALLYSKTDRALQLAKWTTNTTIETVGSVVLSDDKSQYRSVLVTCSNNHYVVYVDGENRLEHDGEIDIDRAFYQIGSVNEGAFDAQKGLGILIDEIGVWNKALTAEHARDIAAEFPVWPRIFEKEIESSEFNLSSIKTEAQGNEIVELTMTYENPVIVVDTTLSDVKTIKPSIVGTLTIKKADSGISESEFDEMLAKFSVNGLSLATLNSATKEIKVTATGKLIIDEEATVTCYVENGETYSLNGIEGLGTLVKAGEGKLSISGKPAIVNSTIQIDGGEVSLEAGTTGVSLSNPIFILGEHGELTSTSGMSITGTLTLESDYDKVVFADKDIWGGPSIVKKGKGRINIKCSSQNAGTNNSTETKAFERVEIKGGTLAFGGTWPKSITELTGSGTLEQAGGGDMTISKIVPEASLKVSAGTLNNECEGDNGSITLAGLEIAAGATYTMKPAIDHLNLTNAFYLEGDAHKNWCVTLAEGALIATNPENPMTLAGLEFGSKVKIGKDQSIGSVLAKVAKPTNMPGTVTSVDERLEKLPFSLEYSVDSLIIGRGFKAELQTTPGQNLDTAKYRINVTNLKLPEGVSLSDGDIRVRITTPYSSAIANVKQSGSEWYAELSPTVMNETRGEAYQIKVELGISDGNRFEPIETYYDVSLNVRPDYSGWIKEPAHERWETGDWDTEGEYITISEGYIQVVKDEKISFIPKVPNNEAVTKLHFAVKFGGAMKLKVLNAIAEEGQLAGVSLEKTEEDSIGYVAWDPTEKEYVPVRTSNLKPIDVEATHIVEITLAQNCVSYAIDGSVLVTKDEENKTAVFTLPKNSSIHVEEIDFVGTGAVKSMTANEYSTKLAKLGEVEDDTVEYDTIEEAIAAAGDASQIKIEPLWDASWVPTPELRDKVIVFTGSHKVIPDTTSGILAENNMVLRPNLDGSYSVISKFLTVTIPDPEDIDGFGVFLESVTTNSMHLGWYYDAETPTLAKAKVIYDDDVTISFSTILDNGANGALLVAREGAIDGDGNEIAKGTQIKSVTFHQVRYDANVLQAHIPVLGGENWDNTTKAKVKMLYDYGVGAPKAMAADINIIDFTAASDGVTFNIEALEGISEADKIAAVSKLVWFSTDLAYWELVADDGIKINEDGSITVKQVGSSGFYKVLIQ